MLFLPLMSMALLVAVTHSSPVNSAKSGTKTATKTATKTGTKTATKNAATKGASTKVAATNAEPSAYPLGDPCDNEWKYLNFDKDKDEDKDRLTKLHNAVCNGGVIALASYGALSADKELIPFLRYFPKDDDEAKTNVKSVLTIISGTDGTKVGDVVAKMIVDNNDFAKGLDNEENCDDGKTYGYTLKDPKDELEKFHFCDIAWGLQSGADLKCGSLDEYPSEKMDIFVRVVLHEMTHHSLVGPKSTLGDKIVDQKNDDGNVAYGVERCHGLIDPDQDDQPGKPEDNADSYAFMALDTWVCRTCAEDQTDNNWQTFFKKNPPAYS